MYKHCPQDPQPWADLTCYDQGASCCVGLQLLQCCLKFACHGDCQGVQSVRLIQMHDPACTTTQVAGVLSCGAPTEDRNTFAIQPGNDCQEHFEHSVSAGTALPHVTLLAMDVAGVTGRQSTTKYYAPSSMLAPTRVTGGQYPCIAVAAADPILFPSPDPCICARAIVQESLSVYLSTSRSHHRVAECPWPLLHPGSQSSHNLGGQSGHSVAQHGQSRQIAVRSPTQCCWLPLLH